MEITINKDNETITVVIDSAEQMLIADELDKVSDFTYETMDKLPSKEGSANIKVTNDMFNSIFAIRGLLYNIIGEDSPTSQVYKDNLFDL